MEEINNIEQLQHTLRIAKCLQGEPVCVINDRQAPHGQGHSALRKWAKNEVFSLWDYKVVNPEIGEIVVDENSARDSFAHGLSPFKIEAIRSIKDVIEQGVVFAQTKIEDSDHYFIAAPVTLENQVDIVSVLVRKDINTQRMYLHSVMIREKILEKNFEQKNTPEHTFPKADSRELSEQNRKLYSGDVGRILQNYLKVNIQQLEVEINQQIAQMKGNKMDEQQQQAIETALKTYPELSREDLTLAANFKATKTPVMEHFESYLLRFEANEYIQSFRQLPIATIAMYVSSGNNAGEYWRHAMQDYVKAAQHIEKFASENPQVSAVQWARTTGNTYAGNGMAGKLMDSSNLFVEEIALRPALKPFLDTYNANPDILQNATPTDINIAVSQERQPEKTVEQYLSEMVNETIEIMNRQPKNQNPSVIASEPSERGNLPTTENCTLNQEIATTATQSHNDNNFSGSLNNITRQKYEQRITDLNSSQSPLDEPKNFAKNSENINQDTQNTPDKSTSNIDNKQKATQDLVNISDYKTFQEKVLFAAVPETEISKMIDEIAKSRTYLAVDFDHKDQAKAAGAKYDPQLKGWYAEEITPEIRPFLPQQPEILTEARKPYSDLMVQAQKIGVDLNSQNFKEEFDKWVRVPLMGKGVKNTDGGYKLFRNDDGTIGACVRNHSTNDTSHWNDRLKDGKQIQGKVPLPDYLANQKQKEWNTIAKHTATKQVAALRSEVATKAYHQLENAKLDDPYIQKKGIENIGKLKRLDDGSTVVPLYHNGKIANLQMIPAYDSSQKRLMTQAEKMGSYYAIGNGKNPSVVIVAEGMATADSVHQIATKLYGKDNVLTLSAIDSGNLPNVAAKVEQNFPTAQKVIAADNDAANEQKSGKNAGLQAAIMVTHDHKDFQVAICPILADDKGNFKNTDWNDYLKAQGKEQAVRAFPESLNGHTAQKTAVKSLEQMTPQQNKTQGGMEL